MTASISASLHPAWVTLRPPIAQKRLSVDPDGYVWIALRHPWADGTTHLRFEPVAMLERLGALIPRPRINLVLYFVILAQRARWRAAVVASAGSEWSDVSAGVCPAVDEGDDQQDDRIGAGICGPN